MPRKLRVYGGCFHIAGHGQVRGIVAGTQAEVARAVNAPLGTIRKYWVETGNKVEIAVATAQPGRVFWCETKLVVGRKSEDYQWWKGN